MRCKTESQTLIIDGGSKMNVVSEATIELGSTGADSGLGLGLGSGSSAGAMW